MPDKGFDKGALVQGLVSLAIAGAVGFLFNSASENTHAIDILNTKMDQVESEQIDIWGKYNVMLDKGFEESEKNYQFQIEYHKEQKEYWKEKAQNNGMD